MDVWMVRWVWAVVLVVAGCGAESSGSPGGPPPVNDPAVSAVADRLDPVLRRDFAASYAGLVLEHEARTVVVYRKPDRALDARVRREAKDVTVELRDARMSLVEMEELRDMVMADVAYWRGRGVEISSAGPKPDGSGIEVMTVTGSESDLEKLKDRYATEAITVRAGSVILATAPRWTPPAPAGPARRHK